MILSVSVPGYPLLNERPPRCVEPKKFKRHGGVSAPGRKRLGRSPSRSKCQSPTATPRENQIKDREPPINTKSYWSTTGMNVYPRYCARRDKDRSLPLGKRAQMWYRSSGRTRTSRQGDPDAAAKLREHQLPCGARDPTRPDYPFGLLRKRRGVGWRRGTRATAGVALRA